jgi:hypothetical protein
MQSHTGIREVGLLQFVFKDLETLFEDLLSLWTTDSAVAGNLFVTTNAKGSDSVTGLGLDWGLASQGFEDLASTSESVTGFTDGDVQHKLLDRDGSHGVGLFGLAGLRWGVIVSIEVIL